MENQKPRKQYILGIVSKIQKSSSLKIFCDQLGDNFQSVNSHLTMDGYLRNDTMRIVPLDHLLVNSA